MGGHGSAADMATHGHGARRLAKKRITKINELFFVSQGEHHPGWMPRQDCPGTRKFQGKMPLCSSIPLVFPLNYARFMETP
jgi:hypothetical protein